MKLEHIINNNSRRLLLVFTGWASDSSFYSGLILPESYDFAVASDYRTPADATQIAAIAAYDEVCVVAWSFGVPAATRFMLDNPQIRFTLRVAVNGTMTPVHDRLGIPEMIFHGTLDRLDHRNLSKFLRRVAGSSDAFATLPSATGFDIYALKDELRAIAALPASDAIELWDSVIISTADAIIPPENQRRSWAAHPTVRELQAPHLPPFASLIPSLLSDKALIARRFSESAATYNANAGVQRAIASRLASMWQAHNPESGNPVLEIGAGTGMLTAEILRTVAPDWLELWNLAPLPDSLPGRKLTCDAEIRIATVTPASFSSILSASTIQWFNSPALFLKRAARALSPGGLLALSTFTPDNYRELHPYIDGSPHYISSDTLRAIIPPDLEILSLAEEKITTEYSSPLELLRHIKHTGVNAMQPGNPEAARTIISDGITHLTYSPLYLVARKKH